MATVNSRDIVDRIIAGNGIYPGDEDLLVIKIVRYTNAWGKIAYGLVYERDGDHDRYERETEYVRAPEVIWRHRP